jgi:hypothetical protein
MANNYGVANTTFKPFSFEEMLKPALMATKSLEEIEAEKLAADEAAALSALDFKGSKYEGKFNDYLNSLTGVADYINKGDIQNAKRAIKSAKNMYVNTLIPAQQRIKKLNTLRDKQDVEQSANPFIRFDIDYRNMTEDQITNNSSYVSYDLDKIYKKVAQNTIDRIAKDFRPQVGNNVRIKGTNSVAVTSGYGMTPEEYEAAIADPNSDLNKYIKEQIDIATDGIKNQSIIDEVTQGVRETIKNNIGKFTTTNQQLPQYNNANLIRQREFDYMFEKDENGNWKYTDNYIKDKLKLKGYTFDADGNPVKSNNSASGNLPIDRQINESYDYVIPIFKGGSARVNTADIDNKLNDDSAYITKKFDGEDHKANKYSYEDLLKITPKGVTNEVLTELVGGDITAAKYYDFYYVDTGGWGGRLYSELKPEATVKSLQNNSFIAEQKTKAAGICNIDGTYYYVGSNGRVLLDKNKNGIQLTEEEKSMYADALSTLKAGEAISIPNSSENVAI